MRRFLRAEILLPVTIVLAAIVLGVSEFLTTFELTPPGAEPLDEVTAADQHSYALLMLALFSVAAMMLAVATGLRPFAFACAGFGLAALLLFLIIDLPDAGKLGTLGGDSEFTFSTAKAEPQAGFVLEAIGSRRPRPRRGRLRDPAEPSAAGAAGPVRPGAGGEERRPRSEGAAPSGEVAGEARGPASRRTPRRSAPDRTARAACDAAADQRASGPAIYQR